MAQQQHQRFRCLPSFCSTIFSMMAYFQDAAAAAAAAAKSLQSCPTLCDPIDGSPPGSPIPGILQARALEWVAISFSSAWKWKVKVKSPSHVWVLATPWTAAYQAPLSMRFSRQEYWSGVPLPSPILKMLSAQLKDDCSSPRCQHATEEVYIFLFIFLQCLVACRILVPRLRGLDASLCSESAKS